MPADDETHGGRSAWTRPGRPAVAIAVALGAVLLVATFIVGRRALGPASGAAAAPVPAGPALDPPQPAQALVFVSGAVGQPGLYVLPATARV
ncbi:MAG TPA: competence protein ComEA, partial [Candidatus Dormibacteraeota bacterium]|nr:competence protein ComEA [Candidatus Dormibacteraeota bacterium]